MLNNEKKITKEISNAIYIAKGIAIILVIIGHYHPYYPSYWKALTKFIYTFHMPLFMFLSGFLFANGKDIKTFVNYKIMVKKKSLRLLLPYMSLTVIIIFAKTIGAFFVPLNAPIDKNLLWYIFVNPIGGFIDILWFIYVLYEIYIIFPFLQLIIKKDFILFCILLFLSSFSWPAPMVLNKLFFHLPIFTFGYLMYKHNHYERNRLFSLLASVFCFVSLFIIVRYIGVPSIYAERILRVLLGISGAASLSIISVLIVNSKGYFVKLITAIGMYSMSIYLFHTISFSPVNIIFFKIFHLSESWFLPSAILAVVFAVTLPILLEIKIFRRNRYASLFILGLPIKKK